MVLTLRDKTFLLHHLLNMRQTDEGAMPPTDVALDPCDLPVGYSDNRERTGGRLTGKALKEISDVTVKQGDEPPVSAVNSQTAGRRARQNGPPPK